VLGFGRKGPSAVGCYGKLPLHGDYVSHQSDSPEARRLTAWLDEGYRLTGGNDDIEGSEISFFLPGLGKRPMVGAFWPSGDASGTRRFPFALFLTLAGKSLSPFGARIPLALSGTWDEMAGALPGIREAVRPEQVQGLLNALEIEELPEPAGVEARFVREAAEAAPLGGAPAVLVDVTRLADVLGGGKRGEVASFAIRIPLVSSYPVALEAAAWLEILAARTGCPHLPGDCHAFVRPRREQNPGSLFLFHRELRAEDLGFLLSPSDEYPWGNLLGQEPDEEASAEIEERLAARSGESPTLADLVEIGRSAD
jgi:type VI secretion system ImpM family protein